MPLLSDLAGPTVPERPGSEPDAADRPDLFTAAAFASLFDRHAASLFRYLARRIGPVPAEDLLSETFAVALRQRDTYDPARARAGAWLFGTATNLLRHHVRTEVRGLRATARLIAADESTVDSPEDRIADGSTPSTARPSWPRRWQLSEGDRDVLLLASWGGLSATEVAEALDIPPGTVRSRLHRARRQLRTHAPRATPEEAGHA